MPEAGANRDHASPLTQSWTFWVDTGGTFTDCIAFSPEGRLQRAKVLSSGVLKASVRYIEGNVVRLNRSWSWAMPLLDGYSIYAQEHHILKITGFGHEDGTLILDQNVDWDPGTHVTITAGEEAPILLARLITGTTISGRLPAIAMRLGTTKGTNALLERKGGKVVFITTSGLEDIVEIGTQQRPDLFALHIEKTAPLYSVTTGVQARMGSEGTVLQDLRREELERIRGIITEGKFDAAAVSLLHAYANPEHERALTETLQSMPSLSVSSGAALYPGIHLLPRSQTAIVNAYLQPVFEHYLNGIREKLNTDALRLITSAGTAVRSASFHPKDALLSGPAGGVVAATHLGERVGKRRIITFDMGGTSTDVARIEVRPEMREALDIGGIRIASPSVAIETVASGGGSICSEHLGKLTVGPESAGAHPGPACYGNGGPLTITDVNLLCGRLSPESLEIPIYPDKAREALQAVHARLGGEAKITRTDLLNGYLRIANETMAGAIRKISVQKGYDPAEHVLLSYGGAGGLHACGVAEILGIRELLLPYDAGLFSATGVGTAAVSRIAHRELLTALDRVEADLPNILESLADDARQALAAEDIHEDTGLQVDKMVSLRYAGQHYDIQLHWDDGDLQEAFTRAYRATFGYVDETAGLEVVRAQVRVSTLSGHPELPVESGSAIRSLGELQAIDGSGVPVFHWEELELQVALEGPVVIVNPFATYAVDRGWTMRRIAADLCICRKGNTQSSASLSTGVRALDLELFMRRFTGIAEEMGAQLQRTARSVNIKRRLDYSCALLDPDAHLLVNAAHIPVHLGSLGIFTRRVRDILPIRPGDVVISNHPAYGGSHLPDVSLVAGVFDDDGRLLGYVANRAHHAEIGGTQPGSMPVAARCLAEEGVVLAPAYLIEEGTPKWSVIERLLTEPPHPTRALAENMADIRAALAALQRGTDGLRALAKASGTDTVVSYMREIHTYSRDATSEAIRTLRPGVHEATEQLDDGTRIRVAIRVKDGTLNVDFSGTDRTHPGNLNATDAIVHSALLYTIRLLITEDIPLNEGASECIHITLPRCFLNPAFPGDPAVAPAVVGGNTETSQRLVDTLLKALQLMACGQGTMNNLVFGNDNFGYYETICGGSGAGDGFDGASAVHQHMTNTRITDPEELEFRYPVRLWRFCIRHGSGGNGKFRGGNGVIREIEFLEDMQLSFLSQHRRVVPFGMAGGEPGATGNQYILRSDGTKEQLGGIDHAQVSPGDRIIIETPGGGGFGRF